MSPIVQLKLKEARRRLRWEQLLGHSAGAVTVGVAVLLVVQVLAFWMPSLRISALSWPLLAVIVLLPLLACALAAWDRWRPDLKVARELDFRADTRDRFITVLTLENSPTEDRNFDTAIGSEVAAYAAGLSLGRPFRTKIHGIRFLWIFLPLLAIVGLEGFLHWRHNQIAPEREAAVRLLAEARQAAAEVPTDEELQEAAKELQEAETALQNSPEPLRDALRALADLENRLAGQAGLSAAERSALADALASGQPQLAAELRAGQSQAAAESLSELDSEAVARALKEAAKHLKNSRLRELARQPAGQARKTLTGIVRGSGEENAERGKFLARMEDLKSGQSGSGDIPDSQAGKLGGNNPPGREQSSGGESDDLPPGAGPGSELDKGRGDKVAGKAERDPTTSGSDDFVPGLQGDGATMVELLRSAGSDDPELRQAYRAAYEAAQPAALDAVDREEIPPGSRILVRRYFEAIRPKE